MLKFFAAAIAALALCGVSQADSFTVTVAQGNQVIATVDTAIADNPLAFSNSQGAEAAFSAGLTDYAEAMALQGLGNITAADLDFIAAQNAFNTVLSDLNSNDPVSFDPSMSAAEPATFLLLALGLIGLVALRKFKPSSAVRVKAAA